jgi:quercetin dioxygenase-like cupin family protein
VILLGLACAHAPQPDLSEILEVAPVESAPGDRMTMGRIVLPPRSTGRWHYHPGDEVVYIVSGRARLTFADHVLDLAPGKSTSVPAHVVHRDDNPGGQPVVAIATIVAEGFKPLTVLVADPPGGPASVP